VTIGADSFATRFQECAWDGREPTRFCTTRSGRRSREAFVSEGLYHARDGGNGAAGTAVAVLGSNEGERDRS